MCAAGIMAAGCATCGPGALLPTPEDTLRIERSGRGPRCTERMRYLARRIFPASSSSTEVDELRRYSFWIRDPAPGLYRLGMAYVWDANRESYSIVAEVSGHPRSLHSSAAAFGFDEIADMASEAARCEPAVRQGVLPLPFITPPYDQGWHPLMSTQVELPGRALAIVRCYPAYSCDWEVSEPDYWWLPRSLIERTILQQLREWAACLRECSRAASTADCADQACVHGIIGHRDNVCTPRCLSSRGPSGS